MSQSLLSPHTGAAFTKILHWRPRLTKKNSAPRHKRARCRFTSVHFVRFKDVNKSTTFICFVFEIGFYFHESVKVEIKLAV